MANLVPAPSNHEMWRAYTIAPAVTPVTFIAIVFVAGVAIPLTIVAVGFLVCYLVAGLIGMPIAFALRRRNALNAWTIHASALLWGILWSILCLIVAIYIVVAIGGSIHSLPLTAVYVFALMIPPVVLSGSAFWLLLKNPSIA
jgi:hypothetical protein